MASRDDSTGLDGPPSGEDSIVLSAGEGASLMFQNWRGQPRRVGTSSVP